MRDLERLAGIVDTRQESPENLEVGVREFVRRAPPGPGPDRVVDPFDFVEDLSVGEEPSCVVRGMGNQF